jgi:hypothetical protein
MLTIQPFAEYAMWPVDKWELYSAPGSSYGRWAIRQGLATTRFFWRKRDALAFMAYAKRNAG